MPAGGIPADGQRHWTEAFPQSGLGLCEERRTFMPSPAAVTATATATSPFRVAEEVESINHQPTFSNGRGKSLKLSRIVFEVIYIMFTVHCNCLFLTNEITFLQSH